jgi:HAD superfamily hydrolase (TIGR01509 family)
VPDGTAAIVFDMDGVLIDSLTADYEIVGELSRSHLGRELGISRALIREHFALDLPEFWQAIAGGAGLALGEFDGAALVRAHEQARRVHTMAIHVGIQEVIAAARRRGLATAVVSNNPREEVIEILGRAGLLDQVDLVLGNDEGDVAKKPAPDTYQLAARKLGLEPSRCLAIEDSLVGVEAAHGAGCYTVAVATGANDFDELCQSPHVDVCYTGFTPLVIDLRRGDVKDKVILTPNDFVSHMVEHIAWRTGCSVRVNWTNNDWWTLGQRVGAEIARLDRHRESAAVIGMIDDGSAEVRVSAGDAGVSIIGTRNVDVDWFLSLRCEQVESGEPLSALLGGLAAGAGLRVDVRIGSFEDPHHTWEGIYRGVGIVIDKLSRAANSDSAASIVVPETAPNADARAIVSDSDSDRAVRLSDVERGWRIEHADLNRVTLARETAESLVRGTVVAVDGGGEARCHLEVANSITVGGIGELLDAFAGEADLDLDIDFRATKLSSSHVVTEDIGLVLGRALRRLIVDRIGHVGIRAFGSSIDTIPMPTRPNVSNSRTSTGGRPGGSSSPSSVTMLT